MISISVSIVQVGSTGKSFSDKISGKEVNKTEIAKTCW